MKRLISVLISALFILTAATAVFAAEDNLLMHWKFDNGDYAKDECGNTEATVYGTITSDKGKFGDCGYFNGTDAYIWVEYPVDDGYIQNATITYWVKIDTPATDLRGILVSEWEESGDISFELDSNMNFQHDNKDGNMDLRSSFVADTGEWYFVALTYNGDDGTKQIYINGELDSEDYATTMPLNFDTFTIGGFVYGTADPAAGSRFFHGCIDDMRVYGSVLSPEQINNVMTAGMSDPDPAEETEAPVEETAAPIETAETSAPVKTENQASSPQTGDTSALLTVLALGAALTLSLTVIKKKTY